MAIQMRRGNEADLDISQLKAGEIAVCLDTGKMIVKLTGENYITLTDIPELREIIDGKSDVGHTHTKSEVGLENVDNTSDLDKPVSNAVQTALDGKADVADCYTKSETQALFNEVVDTSQCIKVSEQNFTDDEKAQARENIGITDTGWQELPILVGTSYSSGFGGTVGLKYRKIANHVYIKGSVTETYNGSNIIVAKLPVDYRPSSNVYFLSPLSGHRIARWYVSAAGDITLEWSLNISDATNYTSSNWYEIDIDFFTDLA